MNFMISWVVSRQGNEMGISELTFPHHMHLDDELEGYISFNPCHGVMLVAFPRKTILPHPVVLSAFVEKIDARWMQFGDYIAPIEQICVVPG